MAAPHSVQAKKKLKFDPSSDEEDARDSDFRTQTQFSLSQNMTMEDSFTPKRLSIGSIDTLEDEGGDGRRTPEGRRTPSPQSSPSKVPATPTPNKTSRYFPQSHGRTVASSSTANVKKPLRFSDPTVAKPETPELTFTPPTPLADHTFAMPSVFSSPAKQNSQGSRFSQSGLGSDSTVTLSTNFNPFSPLRAPSQEMRVKADSTTVSRFVTDFEMVEELGRGSYGVVYKCINRTDGWTYAVKKVTYKSKKIRKHMLKEAFALAALGQHPNIVRYYSSWENRVAKTKSNTSTQTVNQNNANFGNQAFNLKASSANLFTSNVVQEKVFQSSLYIQTEFCEGGSLSLQKKRGVAFTQELLLRLLRQLSTALEHMHAKGFAHGDIKPANILVDTELINSETHFKLGDLGQINSDGDGKYLAPEMLGFGEDITEPSTIARADIFSLGITIFELAFEWSTGQELTCDRSLISQNDIQLPSDRFSSDFLDLVRVMLRADPTARPTARDLLTHPLLSSEQTLRLKMEAQQRQRLENDLAMSQKRVKELEQALATMTLGQSGGILSPHLMRTGSNPLLNGANPSTPLRSNSGSTMFPQNLPASLSTPQNKRPRSISFNHMERSDVVYDVTLPPSPSTSAFHGPPPPSFASSMMDIDSEESYSKNFMHSKR